MQWLLDNWILVLFGGGMIAMHLFGHSHGGHGRHREDASPPRSVPKGGEEPNRDS